MKAIEIFKQRYVDLLIFKNKKGFRKFGFGKGGSYNGWIKSVRNLRHADKKLIKEGFPTFGELEQLGYEYARTKKGLTRIVWFFFKETWLSRKIRKGIDSKLK